MFKALAIIFLAMALQNCTSMSSHDGLTAPNPFAEMKAPKINEIIKKENDDIAWAKAEKDNNIVSYQFYLAQFPKGKMKLEAMKRKKFLEEVSNQVCTLHNPKWIYLSESCLGGVAHGFGQAKTTTGLMFVGDFKDGYRIQGEIYANNILMYDGNLKNGRPHGDGVCIYRGEPESCKYYKGKRIDVLFIQRIEFKHQRDELKEQTRILARQQEFIENRLTNPPINRAPQDNVITNAIKRKAAEKAMDLLFNSLF